MLNKLSSLYICKFSYPAIHSINPCYPRIVHIIRWMLLFLQVSGVLELDQTPEGTARYSALDKWVNQLSQLQKVVVNKMA